MIVTKRTVLHSMTLLPRRVDTGYFNEWAPGSIDRYARQRVAEEYGAQARLCSLVTTRHNITATVAVEEVHIVYEEQAEERQ